MDTLTTVAAGAAESGIGWVEISAMVMAVLICIQTIVRITPTKKDDKIFNPIFKILSFIFNKTNTKDDLKDQVKARVLEEAVVKIAEKHPDAEETVRAVTDTIMKEADREGETKGVGVLSSIPKTTIGKRMFERLDDRITSAKPKTKVGKGLKRLFRRIR